MNTVIDHLALGHFYRGKKVLVTGHTGFKGAWLALWLTRMGSNVSGLALAPDQGFDNLFERAEVGSALDHAEVDLRDAAAVLNRVSRVAPEIVFHLGARAWVQQGYEDPIATFATNTLGTVNLLEAVRQTPSVKAVVCVTTDKVYRERKEGRPYRESDELGGLDPYSASKAAAEFVARSYAHTLFSPDRRSMLATARGGNVLGGGDWSPNRIVPDIVRAMRAGRPLQLRFPAAVRPWQHVLDLCHAYQLLGHALFEKSASTDPVDTETDEAWNFGPEQGSETTVAELVEKFLRSWGVPHYPVERAPLSHHESITLRLDASRANERLGWRPRLDSAAMIAWTADWYRCYLENAGSARQLVEQQIDEFETIRSRTA